MLLRLFFILLALSLFAGCSSTTSKRDQGKKNYCKFEGEVPATDVKYLLRSVDGDITQTVSRFYGPYSDLDTLKGTVTSHLERTLAKRGLLAKKTDQRVMSLYIFVDYRRRFFGDATPFPAPKLAPPDMNISVAVAAGDELINHYQMPPLTPTNAFKQWLPSKDDIKTKEVKNFIGLADCIVKGVLLKRIDDHITGFQKAASKEIDKSKLTAGYISGKSFLNSKKQTYFTKPSGLNNEDYIPRSVVTDYLSRLESIDSKERIKTYKDITLSWINSTILFDEIEKRVLVEYKSEAREKKDEVAWLLKSLASSGIEKYKPVLEKIATDQTAPERVRKRAKNYIPFFENRQTLAKIVHDVNTMSPNQHWEVNQLANILLYSGSAKRTDKAIAKMYRKYKYNDYLLSAMAQRLSDEAMIKSFRSEENAGNHNWFCRVLGESGQVKYKPLLELVAESAVNKKVRKYAERYARVLGGNS